MPEYAKMKNAELEALLKERSLPSGGKKADMVDRLTKDDEKKTAPATTKPAAVNAEDEIDWDDDGDEAAAAPATTAAPARRARACPGPARARAARAGGPPRGSGRAAGRP